MRSGLQLVYVVSLCACGRIGFDEGGVGSGGGGSSSTAMPDALPAGICGATQMLDDTFTASTMNPQWSVLGQGNGITVTQGGGQLSLSYAFIVLPSQYEAYVQVATHDVSGGCASARIDSIPSMTSSAYSYFLWGNGTTGKTGVGFEVTGGYLEAFWFVDPSAGHAVKQLLWNATADKFVRIREAAGTYYWETSADGVAFVPYASAVVPISPAALQIEIGAAVNSTTSSTNAGLAVFGPVRELVP